MRRKAEIHAEIQGLAHSIGVDSYECAALNAKIQSIHQRIQGNLVRMDQLNTEKFLDDAELPHVPRGPNILPDVPAEPDPSAGITP